MSDEPSEMSNTGITVTEDELENIKFHMAHKAGSIQMKEGVVGALLAGFSKAHPRLWLAGEHLREMQPL